MTCNTRTIAPGSTLPTIPELGAWYTSRREVPFTRRRTGFAEAAELRSLPAPLRAAVRTLVITATCCLSSTFSALSSSICFWRDERNSSRRRSGSTFESSWRLETLGGLVLAWPAADKGSRHTPVARNKADRLMVFMIGSLDPVNSDTALRFASTTNDGCCSSEVATRRGYGCTHVRQAPKRFHGHHSMAPALSVVERAVAASASPQLRRPFRVGRLGVGLDNALAHQTVFYRWHGTKIRRVCAALLHKGHETLIMSRGRSAARSQPTEPTEGTPFCGA